MQTTPERPGGHNRTMAISSGRFGGGGGDKAVSTEYITIATATTEAHDCKSKHYSLIFAHGLWCFPRAADSSANLCVLCVTFSLSLRPLYSPAAVDFTTGDGGSSSNCPEGIPSAVARASCSRKASASA